MTAPIGFIGLGHMGGAMAERLVRQGRRVVAFDTRIEAMASMDATPAASVAEVGDRCETVFTCLPSADACAAVAVALAGTATKIHIETSTIGRAGIARVVAAHPAIATVDAPISGGPRGAHAGTLTAIVSGEPEVVDRVRELFALLAQRVFVVGSRTGDAQVAKIVNNALSISAMVVSCEAIVLGVKAGLDARQLVELINVSTGRNSATMDKFPKAILPRTFDYGGPLGIGTKDLQLYLDEAAAEGLPARSVSAAAAVWHLAVERLGPDVDLSMLVRLMEHEAGVEVDGTT